MNANVNFCGVIILLRKLVELGHCTKKEANRIAARIAKQTGADIILSIKIYSITTSYSEKGVVMCVANKRRWSYGNGKG